jgi:Flp pilus assembly protein TadD
VGQRDYEHALPYLRRLLAQHPRNGRLRLMLAEVLREKGMLEASKRELDRVLRQAPRNPEVASAYGVLLDHMGRHKQAERHHRRAVKGAPGSPRYHNNLGFCLFLQRELDEAKGAFRDAIRLDPGFRRAYNNLGFVHGMLGDRDAALSAFSQAGSKALALTNLGLVEEMRGQPLMARRMYERALRAQPGYRPALRNLRAMSLVAPLQREAGLRPARAKEGETEESQEAQTEGKE